MRIEGSVAIVTGGASGLGGATASLLASRGAKTAIFDLNEEAGRAHAARIGGVFFKVDVADDDNVGQAIAVAESTLGTARLLLNCAGVAPAIKTVGKDVKPHALDAFRKAVEINLIGTFNLISKFAARLAQAEPIGEERGVIINTASVAASR
jgi:NAD(P)-dependent dehydrogenase (short-subunit alcohol dehydrogenase family)